MFSASFFIQSSICFTCVIMHADSGNLSKHASLSKIHKQLLEPLVGDWLKTRATASVMHIPSSFIKHIGLDTAWKCALFFKQKLQAAMPAHSTPQMARAKDSLNWTPIEERIHPAALWHKKGRAIAIILGGKCYRWHSYLADLVLLWTFYSHHYSTGMMASW